MSMKKESTDLSKGMVRQPNPLFNPKSSYFYALNAMLGSREGDAGSLTNEEGNQVCVQLPTVTSSLIGHVLLDNNQSILFVVDDDYSYIIEFDPDTCTSNILIRSGCLNFKSYKQIDALYRMVRGCERTIYFTDGYNPYRSINLERLENYLNIGYITPADANADPDNGWNCILFNHFASHNAPCIKLESIIDSNGTLKPGVIQFAIRYLDDNNNATRWIYITNSLPLYNESISSLPNLVDGDAPFSQIEQNYVNKSIILSISNLDVNFKYYQLAAIESNQGLGTVTDVYILDRQFISGSTSSEYLYDGFNPSIHTLSTIDEITINNIYLDTIETHNQIDDRLVLANVKAYTQDWAVIQRAVLLTDVKWKIIDQSNNSINTFSGNVQQKGNTKNPRYQYDIMTYTRDEIYSFGIVFVFENGIESPVFHIPGRAADIYYDKDYNNGYFTIQSGDDITNDIVVATDNAAPVNLNTHYRDGGILTAGGSGMIGAWDTYPLQVVPDGSMSGNDAYTKVEYSNVAHIPSNEFSGTCTGCSLSNETISFTASDSGDPNIVNITASSSLVTWKATVRISVWQVTGVLLEPVPTDIVYDQLLEFSSASPVIGLNIPTYATRYLRYSFSASLSDGVGCGGLMKANISDLGYLTTPTTIYPLLLNSIRYDNEEQNYIGCTIPRWKVYNTAVNLTSFEGLMGYHQISEQYPELLDCNNLSVWDATLLGGQDLSSSNIRHHRFPDVNLKFHHLVNGGLEVTRNIGIRFDLTDVYANIPIDIESKIIGHYIVRAKRDEFNKTVLDKGVVYTGNDNFNTLFPSINTSPFYGGIAQQTHIPNRRNTNASAVLEYLSNNVMYNNNLSKGTYVKYEMGVEAKNSDITTLKTFYSALDYYEYFALLKFNEYKESNKIYDCRHGVHRPIKSSFILPYDSIGDSPVTSASYSTSLNGNKTSFIELDFPMCYPYTVSPSVDNLYLADYEINNNILYLNFINNVGVRLNYISIKVYKDVYKSLESLNYIRTHNCMIDKTDYIFNVFGGDTFITETYYTKGWAERTDSVRFRNVATTAKFYVESTINSALRYSDDWNSKYYPRYFTDSTPGAFIVGDDSHLVYYLSFLNFTIDNGYAGQYEDGGGDKADITKYQRPFEYKYNQDYSKLNQDKVYFPLSNDFDFCDNCEGEEQYSIYYSEKANITDIQDNYKIVLAANFKIMPGESGIITNLFVEQDQLFCHTERALWALQTRPQQLDTNESTLFIGTGEFLSIPPKRLISTKYGYAGSTDKFATIGTQFGTFFVDNEAGQVFQFSGQLKEISQTGMEQWFRKYLPMKFTKQYKELTGLEYLVKHTVDKNAVGFQSVFDPRFKRFILHKKDYLILDPNKFTIIALGDPAPDPLTYNLYAEIQNPDINPDYIKWYYYDDIGLNWVETDLNNGNYFSNESFTISLSCDIGTWVSFHSYQPNFMFNNRNKFYSYINNQNRELWVHNERNYQNYFDVKYDHILEVTLNPEPAQEKIFDSVQYISNVYNYVLADSRFVNIENSTFDRFELSNNNQSSDTRDLVVKVGAYDKLGLTTIETMVDRTDNYWRFNRFRDMAYNRTTEPLFSTDWTHIISYYDQYGQGYVDSVINPNSININKPYYEQARFRDKVAYLRLFFNPGEENDYKISTEIISMLTKPSLR
jgi:hypothetical protein